MRTPAGQAQLIARSPQLGDGTGSADRRCGAAALFNGMVMAGHPREAAAGIRQLAANVDAAGRARQDADLQRQGVPADQRRLLLDMPSRTLSPEAERALRHLEGGRITPREAATLQDTLFTLGMQRPYSTNEHPTGLSRRELQPMARDLAAAGAFGDASMTLHNRFEPDGVSEHWTVSVTPRGGTQQHADSWPAADGFGTVRPGGPSGRYQSHVTVNPD